MSCLLNNCHFISRIIILSLHSGLHSFHFSNVDCSYLINQNLVIILLSCHFSPPLWPSLLVKLPPLLCKLQNYTFETPGTWGHKVISNLNSKNRERPIRKYKSVFQETQKSIKQKNLCSTSLEIGTLKPETNKQKKYFWGLLWNPELV